MSRGTWVSLVRRFRGPYRSEIAGRDVGPKNAMTITISATLKKAIAKELNITPDQVDDHVWEKSGTRCFLCNDVMNRVGLEKLELDHNIPRDAGGTDSIDNLNLTHASCNRYKLANSTVDVRPHLKFKRFYDSKSGSVNFKDALAFFQIGPSETIVTIDEKANIAHFETVEGKFSENIFQEQVGDALQRFCFVSLPISAVTNDDDIQPRQIKLNHLLSIAKDMAMNPLHEQPTCRLIKVGQHWRVLMFDGQHKTVAKLINGASDIVFKVYLDLNREQAVRLVNSIQSRIKKLPLTPFELAAKMADEVKRQLESYENEVGTVDASEGGFIAWLDPDDRARAKAGIASAVIDEIISDPNLAFNSIIAKAGRPLAVPVTITETAFQNQFVKELAHTKPLPAAIQGEEMKVCRQRETRQLIKLMNILYEEGFTALDSEDPSRTQMRMTRLRYQPALKYIAKLMQAMAAHHAVAMDREMVFLKHEISDDGWDRLRVWARTFFRHPIWTADWNYSSKTKAVFDALNTNTGADNAFQRVGLDASYCMGLNTQPPSLAG